MPRASRSLHRRRDQHCCSSRFDATGFRVLLRRMGARCDSRFLAASCNGTEWVIPHVAPGFRELPMRANASCELARPCVVALASRGCSSLSPGAATRGPAGPETQSSRARSTRKCARLRRNPVKWTRSQALSRRAGEGRSGPRVVVATHPIGQIFTPKNHPGPAELAGSPLHSREHCAKSGPALHRERGRAGGVQICALGTRWQRPVGSVRGALLAIDRWPRSGDGNRKLGLCRTGAV